MHGVAALQRGPQRAVQAVLEVDLAVPLHGVREQVAVEGRVLVEQVVQRELPLGGGQLVEADRARRDVGPVARRQAVVGVGTTVPHRLEDHAVPRTSDCRLGCDPIVTPRRVRAALNWIVTT